MLRGVVELDDDALVDALCARFRAGALSGHDLIGELDARAAACFTTPQRGRA